MVIPTRFRTFLIPAVVLLLTGCSTTKPLFLPGGIEDPALDRSETIEVEVGHEVTVFLKSGDRVKGEVIATEARTIVLGRPSNYGWQEDTYQADEILRIEGQRSTGFGRFMGGVVGGVTLVFASLLLLLALFPPDFSGLS